MGKLKRDKHEHWGNKMKTKNKKVVRLLLNNVNGIGQHRGGMKDEIMRDFMDKWDVDIACITEPNVHWGKVPNKDNWFERSAGWFESRRLAVSYHQERGRLATVNQYGGTMTLARNDISHRAVQSGYDPSGMGKSHDKKRSLKNVSTTIRQVVLELKKKDMYPYNGRNLDRTKTSK